jgi:hypothetical protein
MVPGTHEIRRMAYLQAMGIDGYISRRQLPGAAASSRLAVIPGSDEPAAGATAEPAVGRSKGAGSESPGHAAALFNLPDAGRGDKAANRQQAPAAPEPSVVSQAAPAPAFTVVALLAGGVLWLEELSYPALATAQVQLVQSMATALGVPRCRAEVAQFKWPIHQNNQFDQGEDAARAALTGFVDRKLEEHHCRALVLLGASTAQRVLPADLTPATRVVTVSTADMLAQPGLKAQAWRDLQPIVQHS